MERQESRKNETPMKAYLHIKNGIVLVGFLLVLVWTASTGAAILHVPADYTTIQAAVNAAKTNDTIQIAAGVYLEQVVITNKSLTLLGSPGTVLRATPGMAKTLIEYGSRSAPLLGIAGAEVVVSGLTLEGERLADSEADYFFGIFYLGASGRVENCRLTGFRGETLGSGAYATGLVVSNPLSFGTNLVNIQVLKNVFADNLVSIQLDGAVTSPTPLRTTFVVKCNTVTGSGPDASKVPDDLGVQTGIEIRAGAGGEVIENTITDFSFIGTASFPHAHGVLADDVDDADGTTPLAALYPVRYEGNVFRNNQHHLTVVRGDGSRIENNLFEGTGQGIRPWGIGISGVDPLISSNRFRNLGTGILLLGEDPEFVGTYLGVATNAQVTANWFCHVATNIMVEPQATYTEHGTLNTLTCPPPELSIAPAVLLSWPDDGETHVLESAPSPHGPWTPLDAPRTVQVGQITFAVKTDREHHFFRLH